MTMRMRSVAVKQLPEKMTARQARAVFREIEAGMNPSRPHIVLDCSKIRHLDRIAIHLMLCCLEEAMKRNGDVSLAAIPGNAQELLRATGVTRLFNIFETIEEAVNGFHRLPFVRPSQDHAFVHQGQVGDAAAAELASC